MVRERHNVAFLVGVIFGAAGAAGAALLYTPLSGTETRQQLSVRVAETRQQLSVRVAETRQQLVARVAALRGGDRSPAPTGLFGA